MVRDDGLYRLYKHMEKGQKQPNSHSCTELSKTQCFPVSIVSLNK